MNQKFSIPRAETPEEVGVSSKVISKFADVIESENWNIHSFMVIRHGKVACECYRSPFTAETPHAMYSVSKTFTGTAVGIAITEGILSLEDRVRDFFPEICNKIKDRRLDKMTVRHLLTMTSGKNVSPLSDKSKGDWLKAFFSAPWYNEPGVEFRYISDNMYVLCAIIHKISGMNVRDYLKHRLFEPLGISYPNWETDENGIEAGGWGLFATTEDIAKLMMLYQNKGEFNGHRILSEQYAVEAVRNLADSAPVNSIPDYKAGYGYCIWRNAGANGYRADGMFAQFGIVFDDFDGIVCITAGVPSEDSVRDLVWKYFPKAFLNDSSEPNNSTALLNRLKGAELEKPEQSKNSSLASQIEGHIIHFRRKRFLNLIGFPVSVLPHAITYALIDRPGNIDNVSFSFNEKEVIFSWQEGNEKNIVKAGCNGSFSYGDITLGKNKYKVCSSAKWENDHLLVLSIRPFETIGKRILKFDFKENGKVIMIPVSSPNLNEIAEYVKGGFNEICKNKPVQKIVGKILDLVPLIVEPKHYGKFSAN